MGKDRGEGECIGTVKGKADDGIIGAGTLDGNGRWLAQLVITEITVLGAKKYEFTFMDGSKYKVSI